MSASSANRDKNGKIQIERIQTGIRLEKKLVKVLKGLAEYNDMSLGELIELIALHALEREHAFTPDSMTLVKQMKAMYEMNYDVHSYETFVEKGGPILF
jgi:predicted DNA-binding ribbon-helix-helix protein